MSLVLKSKPFLFLVFIDYRDCLALRFDSRTLFWFLWLLNWNMPIRLLCFLWWWRVFFETFCTRWILWDILFSDNILFKLFILPNIFIVQCISSDKGILLLLLSCFVFSLILIFLMSKHIFSFKNIISKDWWCIRLYISIEKHFLLEENRWFFTDGVSWSFLFIFTSTLMIVFLSTFLRI